MNGKGIYTWPDGKKYEGDYYNDKKHGHGIFTWANGYKYDGSWLEGKQHVEGLYTFNGLTRKG